MTNIGGYTVKVSTGGMPQAVESGFAKVFENMVGASYTPIAYLGSKVVNGTNHAILCEQNLITGKDVKSIVLVVLNEKPGDVRGDNFSIVEIRTLLSNGGALGGVNIDPTTNISAEAKEVFDKHFGGFLGSTNKAFALLATQVVHGLAYIFAVESDMVVSPSAMRKGTKSINLVKLYSDYSEIETVEVLRGAPVQEENASSGPLGYAFTWATSPNWP